MPPAMRHDGGIALRTLLLSPERSALRELRKQVAGRPAGRPAGRRRRAGGALAGQRSRQALADRTGWPDARCGLIEDAAAVTVAGVAAR